MSFTESWIDPYTIAKLKSNITDKALGIYRDICSDAYLMRIPIWCEAVD